MRSMLLRNILGIALVFGLIVPRVHGAAPAEVQAAIRKGTSALVEDLETLGHAEKTLAALAAYKGGANADAPGIKKAIEEILERCKDGKYKEGPEHIYQAGIEANLLADIHGEQHLEELTLIRDYIVNAQQANGGWNYPSRKIESGDTSVIQYGCLGLWAVERVGIDVPDEIWEKVLAWHVRYQNQDGGFAYNPNESIGAKKGASELTMTINAIGSMHIAMIHLSPGFEPLNQNKPNKPEEGEKPDDGPKFGVLEKVEIDTNTKTERKGQISDSAIAAVRKAMGFLAPRFRPVNDETSDHKTYYYYSLERMASLANIEKVGSQDWFNVCADALLKQQGPDGRWKVGAGAFSKNDTSFVVLFLTRSTGKILRRKVGPTYGDGLLAGGRGLPDDLSEVNFDGRSVKGKEKPKGPLDELLASLTTSGSIDVEEVQEQIVQKVQLGDREELVKQTDMLVKLVDHPQAEVRRTAAWALGRTDNMELAQHLINLLNDSDLGVMLEARRALCWLSRKPKGFGLADDPLEELPANATKQQQRDAITNWHKQAVLLWGEWYLYNRPFEERGDEFEAILRAKMEGLKSGV